MWVLAVEHWHWGWHIHFPTFNMYVWGMQNTSEYVHAPVVVEVTSPFSPHSCQQVYATDISADALEWAKFNVHRLGMQQRVTCLHGHLLTPLAGLGLQGQLAGIVSNPPYIPKVRMEWNTQMF